MTNQPAGSSVIALEDIQAVQLPLNNKEALLKDPIFLYHIGRNLAMALHRQGITASTNASYFVKERLATHILNIEEQDIFQLSPSILSSSFPKPKQLARETRSFAPNDAIIEPPGTIYLKCLNSWNHLSLIS